MTSATTLVRHAHQWANAHGFADFSAVPETRHPAVIADVARTSGAAPADVKAALVAAWATTNERGQQLGGFRADVVAGMPDPHAPKGLSAVRAWFMGVSGVDYGSPTTLLPRFSVARSWDADSTPPALACLSRAIAQHAPQSGARTPTIEAGVVLASLMHDVAYYYGGSSSDRADADRLFGEQIPYFVGLLDQAAVPAAHTTAAVDVLAVESGGGFPFKEDYSWSYGFKPAARGYATLNPGERERIQHVAQESLREVVSQITSGQFQLNDMLKTKLDAVSPQHRADVTAAIVKLAQALAPKLAAGGADIPGFA